MEVITYRGTGEAVVTEVKVKPGGILHRGKLVLAYSAEAEMGQGKVKGSVVGKVVEVLVKVGDRLVPDQNLIKFLPGCAHPTVMKDMCAECGADLRKLEKVEQEAGVAMVHAIPELKVSSSEAAALGREDQSRLTQDRKLVLLVDLDQTLIHTTNDDVPPKLPHVYHFQLYGPGSPWYHTRIRPGTAAFLQKISKLYELHICTFGARLYAHQIASFLDPKKEFFSHRILSRDECFDSRSKTANMTALFPCGDSMVCIIDDREDVWNYCPNMVHVKPYHFFKHTGDINAPPGLCKREFDDKVGVDFKNLPRIPRKDSTTKVKEKARETSIAEEVEDSSSEDEEPQKKEPRRDSIDMPRLDSNSRDHLEEDIKSNDVTLSTTEDNSKIVSDEADKGELSTCDKVVDSSDIPEKDVGEDLEISDSDSSSEVKSREISDTEEVIENDSKVEDVEDTDDYLLYLEEILRTVHTAYYELYDQFSQATASNETPKLPGPDLKMVIPYVRRKTLQGCTIVFSGVVPTNSSLERSKPFLLAKAMGATVREEVDSTTTHLVAARVGTIKVNEARRLPEVCIVTPDWLWACAERWEKVEEKLFTLSKDSAVTRRAPAHCSSPEIAYEERCANLALNLDGAFGRQPSVAEADPFLSFSTEDLAGMDKEVEDILSGSGESDSDEEDVGEGGVQGQGWDGVGDSTSEDSLDRETPRGHKRAMCRELEESGEDTNMEPPERRRRGSDGDDLGSDDSGGEEDWGLMGAELERELGN